MSYLCFCFFWKLFSVSKRLEYVFSMFFFLFGFFNILHFFIAWVFRQWFNTLPWSVLLQSISFHRFILFSLDIYYVLFIVKSVQHLYRFILHFMEYVFNNCIATNLNLCLFNNFLFVHLIILIFYICFQTNWCMN